MNISARIRSLIANPMTAAEIHELMHGVAIGLIRGCIQTMLASGMIHRHGSKKPYKYDIGRALEINNRGRNLNITQQVRACIRSNGPISPEMISSSTGINIADVRNRIYELKKRKFIEKDDAGRYVFLRESKNPPVLSVEERKQKARQLKARQRRRHKALCQSTRPIQSTPMTVVPIKLTPVKVEAKAQTVDEWLAQGGKIDYRPTPIPFERLTLEDIASGSRRASSSALLRTARNYLAG